MAENVKSLEKTYCYHTMYQIKVVLSFKYFFGHSNDHVNRDTF